VPVLEGEAAGDAGELEVEEASGLVAGIGFAGVLVFQDPLPCNLT